MITKYRGWLRHPDTRSLYYTWQSMLRRCYSPNNKDFKHYGGRGIKVCQSWRDSFRSFMRDMGLRPPGMTLDRINNEGDYEPGNCRWATWKQQRHNARPRTMPSTLKVTEQEIGLILELRNSGVSCPEIAKLIGTVKRSQVWNICKRAAA